MAGGAPMSAGGSGSSTRERKRFERSGDPDHPGEGFKGGEALIDIYPIPYPPRFDAAVLFQLCGVEDKPAQESRLSIQASEVTIAGLPAVLCQQEGPSPFDEHWFTGEVYWVGLPSGRVVHIGSIAADGDEETFQLLQAILATVSFEAAP